MIHKRRRHSKGQSLVEFALLAPVFLTLVFGIIDFSRVVYYRNVAAQAADAAAREMTLPSERTTDCNALAQAFINGNGLTINIDPNSVAGDTDPRSGTPYTSPPPGGGYVYLWPAVARGGPNPSDASSWCLGTTTRGAGTVVAQVSLNFQAWTPIVSSILGPNFAITSTTVLQTEYNQ